MTDAVRGAECRWYLFVRTEAESKLKTPPYGRGFDSCKPCYHGHLTFWYYGVFLIVWNIRNCLRLLLFFVQPGRMDIDCEGKSYIPGYQIF